MNARTWLTYGLLVVLAAALALMTRTSAASGTELPSVANPRGGGLKALKLYLDAIGVETSSSHDEVASAQWRTLVIAAPTARVVTEAEVSAIDARVRAGATLVYLSVDWREQPHLGEWLKLKAGPRLKPSPLLGDPGGATAKVVVRNGPFSGVSELRVSAGRGVRSDDPSLLPVAATSEAAVLIWKKHGDGQILVARGGDLAENRRIELLDNRKLWENLAALGPITFDELHHVRPPAPPLSVGIIAFGAQAVFAVLFLTFARGTRLGPPRPLAPQRHRAGVEYAQSFAWLVRGAKAEAELTKDVLDRLRRLIHDRLGVPLTLPASELGRELEKRLGLAEGSWSALAAQAQKPNPTPRDFAAFSTRAAEIEAAVRGSPVRSA